MVTMRSMGLAAMIHSLVARGQILLLAAMVATLSMADLGTTLLMAGLAMTP